MAKIANLAKNRQMGWRKFKCGYKRRLQSGEIDTNGDSGKNWPWVWQIFKLDDKGGLLGSGGYDENGEYNETSETSQQWRKWRIWRKIARAPCKKGKLTKRRIWQKWRIW